MTARGWQAPGPGEWRSSDALVGGAVTPYLRELFIGGLDAGSRTAFRRYGLPIAGFDFAVVAGRVFRRLRPVVRPAGPAFLASVKPLVQALFWLHPELRYRRRRAAAALAHQEWRQEVVRWRSELAADFRRANHSLQAEDPRSLDDAALADHVQRATALLRRGTEIHFQQGIAWSYPVGEWLLRTSAWTGASPAEALAVLQGASPASTGPLESLRRLAAAVAEAPAALAALRGPAAGQLAALRSSSPRVARHLDAYLGEHGERLVTGYDLTDRTLRELPQVLARSISHQLEPEQGASDLPDARPAALAGASHLATGSHLATRLRDRVPAAFHAAWDGAFAEAALAYGFREEEVGDTYLWPAGLLRRALLATGERGVARGTLTAVEHILEIEPAEIVVFLLPESHGRQPATPWAETLAARAAERQRLSGLAVPSSLGEPEPEIRLASLPRACAALVAGTLAYLSLTDLDAARPRRNGAVLHGQGVGGGSYQGRARLALTPTDFDDIEPGDILVARTTSPAYNVILPILGAVVTDRGGLLCHTAIVARELGIPAVVGTGDATARIQDGARLSVDGDRGLVEILGAGGGA